MKTLIFMALLLSLPVGSNTLSHSIIDLESGEVVEQKNANGPMILASVSKLFTAYFALNILKADFKFKTSLFVKGNDLYFKGSGDPYFLAPHLLSLIQQLQKKSKKGYNLYIDDTVFPTVRRISPIGLEDQADNPSLSGANIEFNRISVWTKSRKTHPPLKNIIIENRNKSSHGLRFKNRGDGAAETWRLHLKEKMKSVEDIPSRNSSYLTGYFLQYLSSLHGIKLTNPKLKKMPQNTTLLATHTSISLLEMVALDFEYSNNLIAEAILLRAAKKMATDVSTLEEAASAMTKWYKKQFPKIEWDKISLVNGSGLGTKNRISAINLTLFLRAIKNSEFNGRSFWSLLSINGHSGGLARRLRSPKYAYHLYGKTGSLYYVNNVAGYLVGKSGKKYAYATFTTDEVSRKILKEPVTKEAQQLRRENKNWYRSTSLKTDQLLKKWIEKL